MIETIQYENLKWHHISNPSEEDYRFLLETYNFHPLDIEDCRGTNQRPKIDEYDDYYFCKKDDVLGFVLKSNLCKIILAL